MTPLGGCHELEFAVETLEQFGRVPTYRLAQLLRGAADTAAVYEAELGYPAGCAHLALIADEIEADSYYDTAAVAKLLSGAAELLRYYERECYTRDQAERARRW